MTSTKPKEPLLTYRQVANRLNVSLNTARKLFDDGELVRIKVGVRGVRGSEADLEAFISRRTLIADR